MDISHNNYCLQRVKRLHYFQQEAKRAHIKEIKCIFYLLTAFNISIVTNTESAMVMGCGALKIPQSILGNILGSAGHCI